MLKDLDGANMFDKALHVLEHPYFHPVKSRAGSHSKDKHAGERRTSSASSGSPDAMSVRRSSAEQPMPVSERERRSLRPRATSGTMVNPRNSLEVQQKRLSRPPPQVHQIYQQARERDRYPDVDGLINDQQDMMTRPRRKSVHFTDSTLARVDSKNSRSSDGQARELPEVSVTLYSLTTRLTD